MELLLSSSMVAAPASMSVVANVTIVKLSLPSGMIISSFTTDTDADGFVGALTELSSMSNPPSLD